MVRAARLWLSGVAEPGHRIGSQCLQPTTVGDLAVPVSLSRRSRSQGRRASACGRRPASPLESCAAPCPPGSGQFRPENWS